MKENKYRVWDGDVMLSLSMGITKKIVHIQHNDSVSIWANEIDTDYDDTYLMQFTGKKDLNGNDIYEGDILVTDDGFIQEVFFNTKYCLFACRDKDGDCWLIDETDEVIGNIFENREILDGR